MISAYKQAPVAPLICLELQTAVALFYSQTGDNFGIKRKSLFRFQLGRRIVVAGQPFISVFVARQFLLLLLLSV